MVKALPRMLAVAGLMTAVLCVGAAAQAGNDIWASWWDRGPNVTYYWDDWTSLAGGNPYTVEPDLVVPPSGGSGSALVNVEDPGASFMTGTWDGFGTRTNFWDLGPGGSMHIDTSSSPQGMDIWVQVTYHQGIAVAPTVNVIGAHRIALGPGVFELRQMVEPTGDVGTIASPEPTGWITYMSLWRLDENTAFGGIDIVADSDMGAIIDGVIVDARVLPEPTAAALAVLGSCALFGLRRYRR